MNAPLFANFCEAPGSRSPNMRAWRWRVAFRCWKMRWRGERGSLRALVESTWLRLGGPAAWVDASREFATLSVYFALLDSQSPAGALRDPRTSPANCTSCLRRRYS